MNTKLLIVTLLLILFQITVILTGYLYSLRLDIFSWGDGRNDGLYYLAYYYFILPIQIIIVIIRWRLLSRLNANLYNKLSFILYILCISYQPLFTKYPSQVIETVGFFSCVLVLLLSVIEHLFLQKYFNRGRKL